MGQRGEKNMKKVSVIITVLLALAAAGLWIAAAMVEKEAAVVAYGEVTIVKTTEQTESMVPAVLIKEEYKPVIPDGVNITSAAKIEANGFNSSYAPGKVKDGKTGGTSYWEGAPNEFPNIIAAVFEEAYNIHAVKVCLCPQPVWGARVQSFSVEISEDGENFKEFLPLADYQFDPDTGNELVLEFDPVNTKAVQLTFTANTGAVGAQIAELEIYTEDISDISEIE